MHLISMAAIDEGCGRFPQFAKEIKLLGKVITKANCPTPEALRAFYPSLDNFKYLDKHYVVNIANNNIRVIALIFFGSQKFYIRHIFNHAEYDRFTDKHRTKGKKS
ncbi:MAG: type II toxin-antitoxin system HigB family toxin [Kluyvera ascorbata]